MKKNELILDRQVILDTLGTEYAGLAGIVSDKFGIVNAMMKRHELDEYGLNMYQCLSANTVDLFDLSREVSSGGLGVSDSEKGAMISCLAEALERYCMSWVPEKDLQFTTIDTPCFAYTAEQYRENLCFADPTVEPVDCVPVTPVDPADSEILWPASLLYLPFDRSRPVSETTSTGMAAGQSIDDCIRSGLLELVERDALMVNFYQQTNPVRIDPDTVTGPAAGLLAQIRKTYQVQICRLYTDICTPVYFCLIWRKTLRGIHFGIGACASLDSDIAVEKALKECLFTDFYSKNLMGYRKKKPEKICALYEHFLYYQGRNFPRLLSKGKIVPYTREETTMEALLADLKEKGIHVYYRDMTTSDVAPTGIHVVKVVAPGLVDLNKSHVLPRLAARRLWTVPAALGLPVHETLCSDPHPFP